jgi:dephospho-CoA kinase
MIVVGLTGSVGMGKSTAAGMLRRLGVPVHDADATVHRLMAPGGAAVARVAEAFPGVLRHGAIDRAALGAKVFGDGVALKRLERILHPLVRLDERRFLRRWRARRAPLVTLDVPLLFETRGERRCDYVIVVTAPLAILAKQMPDAEKRRRADFVVPSGRGRAVTWRALARIVRELKTSRERRHEIL